MTAPIDRAFVELVPEMRNFNRRVREGVRSSVSGVSNDLDSVNRHATSSVERMGRESAGLFGKMREHVKSLVEYAGPALAGLGTIEFFKGAYELAEEQLKIDRQTQAVLKSTHDAARISAEQVANQAKNLSNLTGINKDVVQSDENLLLTFTSIQNRVGKGNDIFNQATKTVLDMSVALKEDGKSAAIQLGKALQDPVLGMTALRRVGVSFTKDQQKMIKGWVEHGQTLRAQKYILAELNREFGGSAAAQATTADKLRVRWRNFREEIGQKMLPVIDKLAGFFSDRILPTASRLFDEASHGTGVFGDLKKIFEQVEAVLKPLVPMVIDFVKQGWNALKNALDDVIPTLKSVAEWMSKHGTLVRTLVVALVTLVGTYKLVHGVVDMVKRGMLILNAVMDANPIFLIIAAVAALTAAFIYAYTHSERFRKAVWAVLDFFKRIGVDVWHAMNDLWHAVSRVWDDVYGAFMAAWHFLNRIWQDITHFFAKWGPTILAVLVPFIGIPLLIWQHWSAITGFLKKVWDGAYGAVKAGIKAVLDFVGRFPIWLGDIFRGAGNWLWNAGKAVLHGLWAGIKWVWDNEVAGLKTIGRWFIDIFNTAGHWLLEAGKQVLHGLWNGIQWVWQRELNSFKNIGRWFKDIFARAGGWLRNAGQDIIHGLWNGITHVWNDVVGWFGKIPGWIKKALGLKSPPPWAIQYGKWIMQGLVKGLIHGSFDFHSFVGHFAKLARKKIASLASNLGIGGPNLKNLALATIAQAAVQFVNMHTGAGLDIGTWVPALLRRIMFESGGNPSAINLSDINAQLGHPSKGLMQVIDPTFAYYSLPPFDKNIYDPLSNIIAAIQYIRSAYGSITAIDPPVKGYKTGAWEILKNQMALIHKGEMVVPEGPARAIRSALSETPGHNHYNQGAIDYERLATVLARSMQGLAFRFDGDGVARLVTHHQAINNARGVRR